MRGLSGHFFGVEQSRVLPTALECAPRLVYRQTFAQQPCANVCLHGSRVQLPVWTAGVCKHALSYLLHARADTNVCSFVLL